MTTYTYYIPYKDKDGNYLHGLTQEELDKFGIKDVNEYYSSWDRVYKSPGVPDYITSKWLSVHPHYKGITSR